LRCSEVRSTQSGKIRLDSTSFLYSGHEQDHKRGVGIFLGPCSTASLLGYWPISDRVIIAKLQAKPFNMNIIHAYAPTCASSEEELENFYDDLDKAKRQCRAQEINLVIWRFECKSWEGSISGHCRAVWVGTMNDRGDI